jgi:hypothetical protein
MNKNVSSFLVLQIKLTWLFNSTLNLLNHYFIDMVTGYLLAALLFYLVSKIENY